MNTQQLFSAIEPWQIVSNFRINGRKIDLQGNGKPYYFRDPRKPSALIYIDQEGFIQRDKDPDFFAGNFLDWLAYMHEGNYEQAVKHLYEKHEAQLRRRVVGPFMDWQDQLVVEARRRREKFLQLLNNRFNLDSAKAGAARDFLKQKWNLDPAYHRYSIYGMTGAQLAAAGVPGYRENQAYVVQPILSNPYTFCHLIITDPVGGATTEHNFHLVSHGFYGLHLCQQPHLDWHFYMVPRIDGAAYLQERLITSKDRSSGICVAAVYFDSPREYNRYRLQKVILTGLQDSDRQELPLENVLGYQKVCEELDVYSDRIHDTLQGYAIRRVQKELTAANGEVTIPVIQAVESVRQYQQLYQGLEDYMANRFTADQLAKLSKHQDTFISFPVGKYTVHEECTGYRVTRDKSDQEIYYTNFTFRAKQLLYFDDEETNGFLFGEVRFRKWRWNLFLPTGRRQSLDILNAVVISSRQHLPSEESRPNIQDDSVASRKLLVSIMRQQESMVPHVRGVHRLGWNRGGTEFIVPGWVATAYGAQTLSQVCHPNSLVLNNSYTFQAVPVKRLTRVVATAWPLITVVSAWLTRCLHEQPMVPVMVKNNEAGLALLKAVFRPLGQTQPVSLNPNIRSGGTVDREEVRNFPIFASCSNPDKVYPALKHPAFCLHDKGLAFPPLTQEDLEQVTLLASQVFQELAIGLLRDNDLKFGELSKDLITQLKLEGKAFIERLTSFKQVDLFYDGLSELNRVLARISVDKLGYGFYWTQAEQSVTISTRVLRRRSKLGDLCQKFLVEQLRVFDPEVRVRNDNYIQVNREVILDILESFYCCEINLPKAADDCAEEKEMQEPNVLPNGLKLIPLPSLADQRVADA